MDDLTAVAYGAVSALLGVPFVFVLWMGGVMSGWIAALITHPTNRNRSAVTVREAAVLLDTDLSCTYHLIYAGRLWRSA